MLSKINQIKDKKKFVTILKNGSKFFCPFFILLVEQPSFTQPNTSVKNIIQDNKPYIEFGFITSKKVGKAVERNHIRRLLSEIINKEILKIKPNTRAVIIAHERSRALSFTQLQKEIKDIFTKAQLFL